MKNTLLCILFAILYFSGNAQNGAQDSTRLYSIQLLSDSEIIAYILSEDEREIYVKTLEGRKFYIPQFEIAEIRLLKENEISSTGKYLGDERFSTRYFISTNGLPLKKGEHYIQWNLYGPDFQFSVADNVGIGFMTTWVGSPLIGNIKYSFQLSKNVHGALGTLAGTTIWWDQGMQLLVPFATITSGTRRANISLSGGYGAFWIGDKFEGHTLLGIAAMGKVSPKVSLVLDSFILLNGKRTPRSGSEETTETLSGGALIIPGVRIHTSLKNAFQIGLAGVVSNLGVSPLPFPMLQWYRRL